MKRKPIYIIAGSILLTLVTGVFAVIGIFLYSLDWEGNEGDLRKYLLPSFIRNVPRVQPVIDPVSYRSKFLDGNSPGFDCIYYQSEATPEAIRHAMKSHFLSQEFQQAPPPELLPQSEFTDFYSKESLEILVSLLAEKEWMNVRVCHLYY